MSARDGYLDDSCCCVYSGPSCRTRWADASLSWHLCCLELASGQSEDDSMKLRLHIGACRDDCNRATGLSLHARSAAVLRGDPFCMIRGSEQSL